MVQSASADVSPPHPLLTVLEAPRALVEYAGFTATCRLLSVGRSGHDRPVLVLPGMLVGDRSTRPLRRLLNTAGYAAYGWKLGTNVGPTRRIINGIDAVLDDITDVHGEPVSVIGWSLGGILGHGHARRHPGAVDRLITLASPLYIVDRGQSRASLFYDEFAPAHLAEYAMDTWRVPSVSSVPATSIFSKTDGVVRWRPACTLRGRSPRTSRSTAVTVGWVSTRPPPTRSWTAWPFPPIRGPNSFRPHGLPFTSPRNPTPRGIAGRAESRNPKGATWPASSRRFSGTPIATPSTSRCGVRRAAGPTRGSATPPWPMRRPFASRASGPGTGSC